MKIEYTLERWTHGLLICSPENKTGIPMFALGEVLPMLGTNAMIASGIAHHYKASGRLEVVACLGEVDKIKEWENEINESLKHCEPETKWWLGTDVGTSSATIFSVLATGRFKEQAKELGRGSTPRDAGDFGRCHRLLATFPEWKSRLSEVALAYPSTNWGKITETWNVIEAADPDQQNEILRQMHV